MSEENEEAPHQCMRGCCADPERRRPRRHRVEWVHFWRKDTQRQCDESFSATLPPTRHTHSIPFIIVQPKTTEAVVMLRPIASGLSVRHWRSSCVVIRSMSTTPQSLSKILAPTGVLRVGLNMSNALLVTGRDEEGTPVGLAPDMGRRLSVELEVPVEMVEYARPQHVVAAMGEWDVACLGAEPSRAEQIWFTRPYVEIEATYLVPEGSTLQSIEEVDREGVVIAVPEGSAYDLFLTKNLQHAALNRAAGGLDAAVELFREKGCDALAGLRPRLLEDQRLLPNSRLLPGKFHAVQQAMGIPRDRATEECQAFLTEFIRERCEDNYVETWMKYHGVDDKLSTVRD